MRKLIIPIFLVLTFLCSPAIAEIITVTHIVKQSFWGSQSPDDARISAVAKAKREALEKAGVYIEALTVVKDARVDKDEILALTAGVVKAEVITQKNYHTEDAFGIEIIVNVIVDTSVLEERVKKLLQDRTHLTQLTETQRREKALLQKVAKLEEENRKLTAKKQSTKELKKQFQQASRGLTALEWLKRADALWDGEKYADPNKAIDYLNNSIDLKSDFAGAYVNRGLAYSNLGQNQRAIEDYTQALRLKSDFAEAYTNRGLSYGDIGQYQLAIQDANEAIRLKPEDEAYYYNRGLAYSNLGQNQRAIEQYNEAIRLKSAFPMAYNNRGRAYSDLGQYPRAIEDYNEVIRLKPDDAMAYNNRGLAYDKLGKYQNAISDYDKVIRLKPDDVYAYYNRGFAYSKLGQDYRAIKDYNEAVRLKPDVAMLYVFRGGSYSTLGQHQRAIEDYTQALRLKSDFAEAYTVRGVSYKELGQYQRAIKDYNEVIRLKPDDATAYNARGLAHAYLGQYKNAREDYDEAIRLKPDHNGTYYNYACLFALQKDAKQACKWLTWAIERGFKNWKHMEADKDFDNVRNEKCFVDIIKKNVQPVKKTESTEDAEQSYRGIKGIELTNGNIIEGQIISWDPDTIKIRTIEGKVLSYDFKKEVQRVITK